MLIALAFTPAADLAFFVVFGAFVLAFVVLAVVTLTWAIRRDRRGRAAWLERRSPTMGRPDVVPNGARPPHRPTRGSGSAG